MRHLGKAGTGYPQIDDFLEVLKKLVAPEEAGVALGPPTRLPPFELEEVEVVADRIQEPVADETICIGGGVCLLHCPPGAAKLKKKNESAPFKDFTALHQAAINDISSKDADER